MLQGLFYGFRIRMEVHPGIMSHNYPAEVNENPRLQEKFASSGHLFRIAGRQVVFNRRLAGGVPHVFQQAVRVPMGASQ